MASSLTVVIRRLDVEFTGTLRFDEAGEELLRIDAKLVSGQRDGTGGAAAG